MLVCSVAYVLLCLCSAVVCLLGSPAPRFPNLLTVMSCCVRVNVVVCGNVD